MFQMSPKDANEIRKRQAIRSGGYTDDTGNLLHPGIADQFNNEQYQQSQFDRKEAEDENSGKGIANVIATYGQKRAPLRRQRQANRSRVSAEQSNDADYDQTPQRRGRTHTIPNERNTDDRGDEMMEEKGRDPQNKLAGIATSVAFGVTHNIGTLTFWLFWQVPFVILSVAFFVLVLWVDQLMNNPQTWWESVLKIAISASNFLASKLSKISEIIFGFSVPNIQEASIALFLIFYFMSIITSWVFLCYALFKAQFSPRNKPSMLGIFACFVVGAIFIVNIYPAFIHASKGKR